MAYSPARTDSSSDLYAPSEPTEEHDPGRSMGHQFPRGQTAPSLHPMRSPGTHLVSTPTTPSDGTTQYVDHGRRREEPSERQVNANPKRKREEDPETTYAVPAHSGDPKADSRSEYFAGHSQSIPQDDVRPLSGPKRVRINGLQPAQASPPRSQTRPTVLPPELWHHVFRFVPPVFLGRLLRVNHAFHSYLTSNAAEWEPGEASSWTGVVRPLDAETIWAASRKRFAPGLPKPLRNLKELDMWRLLRGQACQLCGQTKDPVPMAGDVNPWESGPGDRTVRIIWPFGIRSCGSCLEKSSEKVSNSTISSNRYVPLLTYLSGYRSFTVFGLSLFSPTCSSLCACFQIPKLYTKLTLT